VSNNPIEQTTSKISIAEPSMTEHSMIEPSMIEPSMIEPSMIEHPIAEQLQHKCFYNRKAQQSRILAID
jgi:hypothetical protein